MLPAIRDHIQDIEEMRKRDINHQYPSGTINPSRTIKYAWLGWNGGERKRDREEERKERRDVPYVHERTSACVACVFIERRSKVVVGDEKPFFFIRTARTRMIIEKEAWEMRNLIDGMQPKMTFVLSM